MAAASPEDPPKEEKCTPAAAGAAASPAAAKPSPTSAHDEIKAVARKFADSPIQNPDQGAWAILTAISKNARQRPQGMNIILNGDEHSIGRLAETRFQIVDVAISGMHCKIYRKRITSSDDEAASDLCTPAFLKDTSTNGTFHNWKKIRKCSPEARLQHGDIVSFVAPPHEDRAYAFVYREVSKSKCIITSVNLKRKSEDFASESKRVKGIGIGAAEGPVSLDDVRSLQRSNTDLRKQLESQVITIEALRSEYRETCARHENGMKGLKESITNDYANEITELKAMLETKIKEVDDANTTMSELRNSIKDLNERHSASAQSRIEADEIIHSQKIRVSELEEQLDEERNQRREEREQAAADLKSALQRVQAEAQDEIKRQAESYLRQLKEQEEVISRLQDSEKESRTLVDTLRSKLEDTRESLVLSEKKVRQLENQVHEGHMVSENNRKRAEDAVLELKRLRKELEVEKVAREEAWAKVSALELEISAAMHELSIEKQRFQGARERIILRETQLRAFYSTTEEISALFAKQQEQLKAMQKTLEDEENCENTSIGFDLSPCPKENANEISGPKREKTACFNKTDSVQGEAPGASTAKSVRLLDVSSSEDTSATEKHDCEIGSQDGDNNTQDLECTSAGRLVKGFGSDIDAFGVSLIPGGELLDTEQVPETESPGVDAIMEGHGLLLQRCSNLAGETMQLDDDPQLQDNMEKSVRVDGRNDSLSQSRLEDTEVGTIRTADLLASEVPGSWANSTTPSVHGDNESPRQMDSDPGRAAYITDGQADESQTNVATSGMLRLTEEHLALNAMIEIVAPEFKDQFRTEHEGVKNDSLSDAETEEGCSQSDDEGKSDDEGESDGKGSVNGSGDEMIEDSVG